MASSVYIMQILNHFYSEPFNTIILLSRKYCNLSYFKVLTIFNTKAALKSIYVVTFTYAVSEYKTLIF